MVSDKTEEEQLEALKKWFEENGTSLIVGIVLALGGVFGYQAWQSEVRETGEEASALYQDLVDTVAVSPMEQLSEDQVSTAQFIADQLKTDFEDTTYAHFAAMFMARIAAEGNDLESAASELRWVLEQGPEESIELIVRPRLARLLLAQDKPDEAMQVPEGRDPGAHESTWAEVRG
ncbi:MAG: tetratricopeptide repeat protein, partial [Pseudomonadales bacterium]|nr:tetratricopeptide repeat protein [Pseudomonadales bacterium]